MNSGAARESIAGRGSSLGFQQAHCRTNKFILQRRIKYDKIAELAAQAAAFDGSLKN